MSIKGLCLGSGGVKGFVHLGVLEYLYEQGIEFDMVSGSSIGSIMGAMYAMGLTPREMLVKMVESGLADSKKYLASRFVRGGMVSTLKKVFGTMQFCDLKKPFVAVAVDMYTGRQINFSSGSVAEAVGASSAIPPYFKPVKIGDATYVDGAFINSVPADVLVQMGAQKILSVNLCYTRPTNKGNKRALDILYPSNKVLLADVTQNCYKYSDLVIDPDLSAFRSFDFSNSYALFGLGYEHAVKFGDKLLNFIE